MRRSSWSPTLEGASVADLFIKKQGSSEADPRDALMEAYDEAAPDVEKAAAGKEICVVVVPDDEPGTVLKDALKDVLPDATVIGCERRDEIIFYREQLELAGNDLPQLGDAAEEAFRQRETQDPGTLHCREDILEWQTAPTPCGGPARKMRGAVTRAAHEVSGWAGGSRIIRSLRAQAPCKVNRCTLQLSRMYAPPLDASRVGRTARRS